MDLDDAGVEDDWCLDASTDLNGDGARRRRLRWRGMACVSTTRSIAAGETSSLPRGPHGHLPLFPVRAT
jgi:hypothetical protein